MTSNIRVSLRGLLLACCASAACLPLLQTAFAQEGADAQTQSLVRRLREGDERSRRAAAEEIKALGAAAVPALALALRDPDDGLRKAAAEALGRMGPEARSAVPALTEALRDGNDLVRGNAAFALGQVGAEAEPAVPALNELL